VTTSSTAELSTSTDELEETSAQTNNEELPRETVREKEKSKGDEEIAASEEKGDVKPRIIGVKRKKHAKVDKVEMVIEKMYSKISSQQAESDRIFAEL